MSLVIDRDVVTVEGPDAASYLQGQLSNDVLALSEGSSCWSFLLEPSGKLGFLVRVTRASGARYELDGESGTGGAVEARLRRFFLRTKADISTGQLRVDLDGAGAGRPLIGWWGVGTQRVTEAAPSDSADVRAAYVAAGWPGEGELTPGAIPGETLLVPIAVSFDKGCYTGQELVARIDSRGNKVPRLLRRVELSAPATHGDAVHVAGEEVGRVTTASGDRALAYVHRRVEPPAEVVVNDAVGRLEAIRAIE